MDAKDDNLFPSGPWTGFYNYSGPEDRHRMDLRLRFASGRLSGDGTDDIGPFLVQGGYDTAKREAWWTKTYLGAHSVSYHGFRDGVGIWGTWEIPPLARGGFHIWPRAHGNGESDRLATALEQPVELVEAVGQETKNEPSHPHS